MNLHLNIILISQKYLQREKHLFESRRKCICKIILPREKWVFFLEYLWYIFFYFNL